MTLAQFVRDLRDKRKLSLADVCERAGGDITRPTVWKVEKAGHLPKGKTLMKIAKGIGLKKGTKDFNRMVALWTNEMTERGQFHPQELAGLMAEQILENDEVNLEFFDRISRLSNEEFDEIRLAVNRPEVMGGIATLNRIYEAGLVTR